MPAKTKGRPAGRPKLPPHRPSIRTDALIDRICDELASGMSLIEICDAADMPHRLTILKWMRNDEALATRIARARDEQADFMDDLIYTSAKAANAANFQAVKVKIDAYKWRAAKLAPKKYGDRTDLNISGTLQTLPQEALDARIAELLRKAGTGTLALGKPEEDREE